MQKVFWDLPRKQFQKDEKLHLPPFLHTIEVFPLCASGFSADFRSNFCIVFYVRRLWLVITDVNAHDLLSTPRKKDKSTVRHKLPKRLKKLYILVCYSGVILINGMYGLESSRNNYTVRIKVFIVGNVDVSISSKNKNSFPRKPVFCSCLYHSYSSSFKSYT